MATLVKQAEAKNQTVIDLIVQTIRSEGSILGASHALKVSPNALRHHLDRAGLHVVTKPAFTADVEAVKES